VNKKVWQIIIFWVLAVGVAFLATWPFLNSYYIATDFNSDAYYHVTRFVALSNEIKHLNFPININASASNGYGRPEGLFYPQFFLMIPATLAAFGMNLLVAFKSFIFLINLATIAITYWVGKKIFKNSIYAWVLAILYTFAPYRLGDITLRVALGEFQAFTFMPLFLYSIYDILYVKHTFGQQKRKFIYQNNKPLFIGKVNYLRKLRSKMDKKAKWWLLPLSFFGIINSHLLSAEFMLVVLFLFLLLNCIRIFKNKVIFKDLLKAGITSVLVSLSFLLPLLEQSVAQKYNYPTHWDTMPDMLSPLKLLFSNAIGGYGESWGKGILLVVPLIFLVIPAFKKDISKRFIWHSCAIGLLFLVATTTLANWHILYNILPYQNFPYRLNIVFIACIIFAITYGFSNVARGSRILQVVLVVVVLVNGYLTIEPIKNHNISWATDDKYWQMNNPMGTYALDYFPKNFNSNDVEADLFAHVGNNDYSVGIEGKKHIVNFSSDEPFTMVMPIVYYTGYKAYTTDGKKKIQLSVTENAGARIVVSGDKSLGKVVVVYKSTFLQIFSKVITYPLLLWLIYLCYANRPKRFNRKLKIGDDLNVG